jgi:hypothetical protein
MAPIGHAQPQNTRPAMTPDTTKNPITHVWSHVPGQTRMGQEPHDMNGMP